MIAHLISIAIVALPIIVVGAAATSQGANDGSHGGEVLSVPIHRISEERVGGRTGAIHLRQTDAALELIVELEAFPPGWHAMHVHENPSCAPALVGGVMVAGAAAGMHYDPTGVMNKDDARMPAMSDDDTELAAPRDGKAMMLARAQAADTARDAPEDFPATSARRGRPRGDLPAVYVKEDGTTQYRILTYRLRLEEIRGRSIMLHQHGEAPADPALPLGGGKRIACGVIQ